MEDVGYMARISYVFDDTMTKLGLQGKAIMPFLVSFGCNIGGITGTRVIDSWGQRVMTIALSWVVPCASTWGVVGLVSGTFFGNGAVVVVLALFAVAFLHIFITYKVFGRSLNKVEGRTGLIMELPPYHKPHWKSLFGSVFSKMGNVLSRALRIIICISVIFWLLSYSADGNVANSIIYKVGTFIEPVTSLFGLPWQLFIAFVASAMGKEASLGVMASLFNTGSIWAAIEQSATVDTAALSTSMLSVISRPEALCFPVRVFLQYALPDGLDRNNPGNTLYEMDCANCALLCPYSLDYGNDCVSRRSCYFLKERSYCANSIIGVFTKRENIQRSGVG